MQGLGESVDKSHFAVSSEMIVDVIAVAAVSAASAIACGSVAAKRTAITTKIPISSIVFLFGDYLTRILAINTKQETTVELLDTCKARPLTQCPGLMGSKVQKGGWQGYLPTVLPRAQLSEVLVLLLLHLVLLLLHLVLLLLVCCCCYYYYNITTTTTTSSSCKAVAVVPYPLILALISFERGRPNLAVHSRLSRSPGSSSAFCDVM